MEENKKLSQYQRMNLAVIGASITVLRARQELEAAEHAEIVGTELDHLIAEHLKDGFKLCARATRQKAIRSLADLGERLKKLMEERRAAEAASVTSASR
jgi:hypothetical protein